MAGKEWWKSKTLWTSGFAFVAALATAAGLVSVETFSKVEGLLLPLIFVFLRIGDEPLTK